MKNLKGLITMTTLTKNQTITKEKTYKECGKTYRIRVTVRFDDRCGNGHNTFSITGDIDRKSSRGEWLEESGGCIHDEIAKHFPELAPYIKWHLSSSNGPMHYLANTRYWLEESIKPDQPAESYREAINDAYRAKAFEHAKSSAVWPDMPESLRHADRATIDGALTDYFRTYAKPLSH